LEWWVLKRYRTIGGQLRDLAGTKGRRKEPDAITQARLVRGLTLTMTRALGRRA
jgi:hypothetical protein